MQQQKIEIPQLENEEWICDLAFLADLNDHLNNLNINLQGKDNMIVNLYDHIKSFLDKLKMWMYQIENNDLYHFPSLNNVMKESLDYLRIKYKKILEDLLNEFNIRFGDLKSMDFEWKLYNSPFSFQASEAPSVVQLELIDLQNDSPLRTSGKAGLELYRELPETKFPNLRMYVARVVAMFGTTYLCEQFFLANLTITSLWAAPILLTVILLPFYVCVLINSNLNLKNWLKINVVKFQP